MVDFSITWTLSTRNECLMGIHPHSQGEVNPLNPPYQGDFEDFEADQGDLW